MDENYWGQSWIPQFYYRSKESDMKPYLEIHGYDLVDDEDNDFS